MTRKHKPEEDPEIVRENYPSMLSTVVGYHRTEDVQEEDSVDDEPVDREQSEDVAGAPGEDINRLTTGRDIDKADLDRSNVQASQEEIDDGTPCRRSSEPGESNSSSNIINPSRTPEREETEPDASQTEANETNSAQEDSASGLGQMDEPVERREDDVNLPTTKGMFKKGDKLKISVNQEWRQVIIRSCYRKNKRIIMGLSITLYFQTVTVTDLSCLTLIKLPGLTQRLKQAQVR